MATVMTATQAAPSVDRAPVQAQRLFYVIAAYTVLMVTAVGVRNIYLHGRAPEGGRMTGQIVPLTVTNGGPPSAPERHGCMDTSSSPANADAASATSLTKRQRVRPIGGAISQILDQGYKCSATFRGLVERLEQSSVLVYIEPGRCPAIRRQRLNGCLADLGPAGSAVYMRIIVDVGLRTDQLIATIGHELQHAIEAGEASAVARGHGDTSIEARARHVGANVYETDAAQDVKEAIRQELHRAGPACAVPTGAGPRGEARYTDARQPWLSAQPSCSWPGVRENAAALEHT